MNWISPSSKISFRSKCWEAITSSLCHRSVKALFAESPQHLGLSSMDAAPSSVCAAVTGEKVALFSSLYQEENLCPL